MRFNLPWLVPSTLPDSRRSVFSRLVKPRPIAADVADTFNEMPPDATVSSVCVAPLAKTLTV